MDSKPSSRDRVWGSQALLLCVLICKAASPPRLPKGTGHFSFLES